MDALNGLPVMYLFIYLMIIGSMKCFVPVSKLKILRHIPLTNDRLTHLTLLFFASYYEETDSLSNHNFMETLIH